MSAEASGAKAAVAESLRGILSDLVSLAEAIHDDPELAFDEVRAATRLIETLRAGGFAVEEGVCDLPTAFRAEAGSGDLAVAFCAEYDALPGIGHACGHNLIAASAVGAGLLLAPLAEELGMRVVVVGTPAEEGGGGKVLMLERGGFDGLHAAMMVHPWPEDRLAGQCLAVDHLEVRYRGRGAHASAAPWEGVNAADALVVAQVALGLLRQHFRSGDQVHGIVTNGGEAPNVIPAFAAGRFMVRALDLDALARIRGAVQRCFDAGALATGASLEVEQLSPTYSHMVSDTRLLEAWRHNAEALGRCYEMDDAGVPLPTLSTDMANVSLALPAIHPLIGLDAGGAVNHQPEFAAACVGESANRALHDGVLGLAWTAIDAATDERLRSYLASAAS
jgi:amidohydrolase